jgi:hypothetical protein
LFDHVYLEAAFAAARGGIDDGLEVGREIPQVRGCYDARLSAELTDFVAKLVGVVQVHLIADDLAGKVNDERGDVVWSAENNGHRWTQTVGDRGQVVG